MQTRKLSLAAVGPGLLLAATGVGSGDLATGAFVGSLLGTAVLWAVLVGAMLKFVVTEGVARWQLATGHTFLEGLVRQLGPAVIWVFLPYLLVWTLFVGSAMMSACGVALHALLPFFDDPDQGKIVFGAASSLVGIGLVLKGGYRLFEAVMRVCIGIMFITVILTAAMLWPGTGAVLEGLLTPTIPDLGGSGLTWTVALIGGVGGTLTVVCYGYWMREAGRTGPEDLWICRLDLGAGYLMTAIFGVAMVIVGSTVAIEGQGTTLLVTLADRLEEPLGVWIRWLFLVGAFGTVFSSLLGVWQSVPYLFADCWRLTRARAEPGVAATADASDIDTSGANTSAAGTLGAGASAVDTSGAAYRSYLVAIGTIPVLGLFWGFRTVQMLYTVSGALFFPFLALALLIWNGRAAWVGAEFRNGPATTAALVAVLVFFSWLGARSVF